MFTGKRTQGESNLLVRQVMQFRKKIKRSCSFYAAIAWAPFVQKSLKFVSFKKSRLFPLKRLCDNNNEPVPKVFVRELLMGQPIQDIKFE